MASDVVRHFNSVPRTSTMKREARVGISIMRRLLTFLVIAVASLSESQGSIAAPPNIDDILLTLKARQLFYQDEQLRPYNIGIQVVDRVAILFGSIPKAELVQRAETKLRGIFEIRDIRNELNVSPALPPLPGDRLSPVRGQPMSLQQFSGNPNGSRN
jgi:hypothetical protein